MKLSRKAIYESVRTPAAQREWSTRNSGYLKRHREASEHVDELVRPAVFLASTDIVN